MATERPIRCTRRFAKSIRARCCCRTRFVRVVCCVRYEIPGETQLCGSCPLLLTMNDETLALQNAVRCGNALE